MTGEAKNHRANSVGAILGVILACPAVAEAGAACSDTIRIDLKSRLGVAEIAGRRLPGGPVGELGPRMLIFEELQSEARPVRNGWTGVALVYGLTDGISEDVVGGIIWTRRPGGFPQGSVATLETATDALQVRFSQKALGGSCPEGFTIRLDSTGLMTAGGMRLGYVYKEPKR